MKILAINSSFRGPNGVSAFLIDQLFEGAKEKGAECETIHLAGLKINPCRDCQVCQQPDHLLKCVHDGKDDAGSVFEKMREADLILFATPVYTFGMSSLLKMLFERYYSTSKVGEFQFTKSGLFFHHVDEAIFRKPFALLIVYDNLETEMPRNILSYFKTYAKFMDVEMVGTLVRKSAGMLGVHRPEKSRHPSAAAVFEAYRQAGRELALHHQISRPTEKTANQPMIKIPFFAKTLLKLGIGKEKIKQGHAGMMQSVLKRNGPETPSGRSSRPAL